MRLLIDVFVAARCQRFKQHHTWKFVTFRNVKIYLDIDGVLLTKDKKVPEHGDQLLAYLVQNYDCYWLTTHCHGGGNNAMEYLSQYYPDSILEKLPRIKRTDWTTLKTEAIDFDSDFVWLEDCPFESEKIALSERDKIKSLIVVDLKREGELKLIQEKIELISGNPATATAST